MSGSGEFFVPRVTKLRAGRPKGSVSAETRALREHILAVTSKHQTMTVRQVFYALTVRHVVPKTDSGYQRVGGQVLAMRRAGLLDWGKIADATRWQRKPTSWDDAADYAESFWRGYRRNLWQRQGVRIEIWLEKDALAGVLVDMTSRWDVALMVSRGTSSATFLYGAAKQAAEAHRRRGTATYVYALYDFDAGGDRAARTIERDLPEYAGPGVPIHFERLAITPAQIRAWNLPTRPPKPKDPEAKKWGNKPAVELDAIPPNRLTALVEAAIVRHVDQHAWEVEQAIEKEEREVLEEMAWDLRSTFDHMRAEWDGDEP